MVNFFFLGEIEKTHLPYYLPPPPKEKKQTKGGGEIKQPEPMQ